MNNSKVDIQNVKMINKELLEPTTPFHSVVSNQKLFGSNDAYELETQLRRIRSNLSECIKNLQLIDYDYNEVVDKDQFESLKNNYLKEKKLIYFLRKELLLMKQDILQLENLKSKIKNEISNFQKQNETSKRSLTPRPDWNKYKYMINNEKSYQSSNHMVKFLTEELTATKFHLRNDHATLDSVYETEKKSKIDTNFILVTHREILDTVHQVFNRKLNRSELEFILNELIASKIDNDYLLRLNLRSVHKMCRFSIIYFQSKFKSKDLAFEWIVNVKESCRRFSNLKLAKHMKLLLEDQANDQILNRFYSSLGSFYYNLIQKFNDSYKEQSEVFRLIKYCYENKSHIFINELNNCVKKEKYLWNDSKLNVSKLCNFLTNRDSVFIRTLKDQFEAEKLTHFRKTIDLLKRKNDSIVCLDDFLSCVREIEINFTQSEINKYVSQIFPDPTIIKLDFPEFEKRLKNCLLIS